MAVVKPPTGGWMFGGAPSTRTLHGAETIDGHGVSPDPLEPGASLWELRTWRCVFTGTAVQLYAGEAKVASVYVHGRREVESIARKWHRAVQEIVRLEKPAGPAQKTSN